MVGFILFAFFNSFVHVNYILLVKSFQLNIVLGVQYFSGSVMREDSGWQLKVLLIKKLMVSLRSLFWDLLYFLPIHINFVVHGLCFKCSIIAKICASLLCIVKSLP